MQDELISRQAAIDAVNDVIADYVPNLFGRYEALPLEMASAINRLPSVNPQPKTGHWEKMVEVYDLQQNRMLVPYGYDDAKFGNTPVYVCACGCESNKNSRFCPDCGCRMVDK